MCAPATRQSPQRSRAATQVGPYIQPVTCTTFVGAVRQPLPHTWAARRPRRHLAIPTAFPDRSYRLSANSRKAPSPLALPNFSILFEANHETAHHHSTTDTGIPTTPDRHRQRPLSGGGIRSVPHPPGPFRRRHPAGDRPPGGAGVRRRAGGRAPALRPGRPDRRACVDADRPGIRLSRQRRRLPPVGAQASDGAGSHAGRERTLDGSHGGSPFTAHHSQRPTGRRALHPQRPRLLRPE